jgi:Ca2+/Na+ antiporter
MATYRTVWIFGAVFFGAIGVWASVQELSLVGALTIFALVAIVAGSVALYSKEEDYGISWRRTGWVGVLSGAAFLGAAGLMSQFGRVGFFVVMVLGLLCPALLARVFSLYRRLTQGAEPKDQDQPRRHPHPRNATAHAHPQPAPPQSDADADSPLEPPLGNAPWLVSAPDLLDDRSLCLAWRTTYVALQQALSTPRRLRLVQRRQDLMDELERRNGIGFAAWLASGPRAAGDPSKYIVAEDHQGHRHDQR